MESMYVPNEMKVMKKDECMQLFVAMNSGREVQLLMLLVLGFSRPCREKKQCPFRSTDKEC